MDIIIRRATVADAADLSRLAGQLGYPTDVDVLRERVRVSLSKPDETIIVAQVESGLAGWTSVSVSEHFYTGRKAEISGFVVEETLRGKGIGKLMMAETENWARAAGCPSIRLRANSIRIAAHVFYRALGFESSKQQLVFEKKL